MLTGLRLEVEEMALTAPNQRRKLEAVLEAVNRSLEVEGQPLKWNVESMWGLGWGGVPARVGDPGSLCPTGLLFTQQVRSSASGVGAPWGLPGSRGTASCAKPCTPLRANSPACFSTAEVSLQQSTRPFNGINAVNGAPAV